MGKYEALGRYLQDNGSEFLTLTFSRIEKILSFPLPISARKYRPWWANDYSHRQACDGWLLFGYKSELAKLNKEIVSFRKTNEEKPVSDKRSLEENSSTLTPRLFERLAGRVMGIYLGSELRPGKKEGWPKLFDLVSDDYSVVGDAKYLSMVRGKRLPPAKLSTISEHVWMLEKINTTTRFLVFGNDKRVPQEWLRRYGNLNDLVDFYFITNDGEFSTLKRART